jgi:invasion protein IalB
MALAAALSAAAQDAEAPETPPEAAPAEPAAGTEAPAEADAPAGAPAEGEAPADSGAEAPAVPGEGEAALPQGGAPTGEAEGQVYVRDVFTDWQLRCERAAQGEDPCQLYQLLRDGEGNSVAEFALFNVPDNDEVAAGATIITPLMTLLTEPLTLSVDGGEVRPLQLQWCTEIGCVVQFGLTEGEVQSFRRGAMGRLTLVPVMAADRTEALDISLSGFTAGFAALEETTPIVEE